MLVLAVTRLTRLKIGNLFKWGEGLFGEQRQLHLFGPYARNLDSTGLGCNYHGSTYPKELLEDWFPPTGLITLSQHDEGRPQILLEAMAASLPVVASVLPAHRDLILSGETGMLVDSLQEFKGALQDLGSPITNQRLGLAARQWVKSAVGSWDDCAARYFAAYQKAMGTGQ